VSVTPIRIAAVASSPVFYQVPLYRRLAADPRVDLTVLYASSAGVRPYDADFGNNVTWDVDLLDGYRSEFLSAADRNEVLGGFFALADRDIFWRILRGRFDVVWVHGFSYVTLWLAMAAAFLRRRPILLREEQTLLRRRTGAKRFVRAGVLRSLFAGVHGLYIGSNNRRYFSRYGVPDERLFFTPYCVDNDELRREAEELAPRRAELRRRFGIASDGPVFLFVGKLSPVKQPGLILEAFRRAREAAPCALLIVGAGELEAELREQIARDGIRDVVFAGFLNRSDIAQAYAAADALVLFSRSETWGLVVNEAMNFSLPVVVSSGVGCGADLVQDGANGYVVDVDDVDGLARAFESLLDPVRREELGRRSRELVERWSYDAARDGIVAACEAAAGGRR